MNNTICRNFEYNEKADGSLELISLNCDKCEFDNHCDIKATYELAKNYSASFSIEIDKALKGDEDGIQNECLQRN